LLNLLATLFFDDDDDVGIVTMFPVSCTAAHVTKKVAQQFPTATH